MDEEEKLRASLLQSKETEDDLVESCAEDYNPSEVEEVVDKVLGGVTLALEDVVLILEGQGEECCVKLGKLVLSPFETDTKQRGIQKKALVEDVSVQIRVGQGFQTVLSVSKTNEIVLEYDEDSDGNFVNVLLKGAFSNGATDVLLTPELLSALKKLCNPESEQFSTPPPSPLNLSLVEPTSKPTYAQISPRFWKEVQVAEWLANHNLKAAVPISGEELLSMKSVEDLEAYKFTNPEEQKKLLDLIGSLTVSPKQAVKQPTTDGTKFEIVLQQVNITLQSSQTNVKLNMVGLQLQSTLDMYKASCKDVAIYTGISEKVQFKVSKGFF